MQDLHDLLWDFSEDTPAQSAVRLEKIKKLLEAGADPNGSDEDGSTPLGLIASDCDTEKSVALIALLMDHGANPLILDIALERSQHHATKAMFWGAVRAEARGAPLRCVKGGNILHCLATWVPGHLGPSLLAYGELVPTSMIDTPPSTEHQAQAAVIRAWAKAPRTSDGATPLHCLSASNSFLGIAAASKSEEELEDASYGTWLGVDVLLNDLEVDIHALDHAGTHAGIAFLALVDRGLPLAERSEEVFDKLCREVQHHKLDNTTPTTSNRPASPRI